MTTTINTALTTSHPAPLPLAWAEDMLSTFHERAAHAFILHGNVADYVRENRLLRTYLCQLNAGRDIVVFYNLADGITFWDGIENVEPLPDGQTPTIQKMRERFIAAIDIPQPPTVPGQKPAALRLPKEVPVCLSMLDRLLRVAPETASVAVVIEYADKLMPASETARMTPHDRASLILLEQWARDPQIAMSGHQVVLCCRELTELHPDLVSTAARYAAIELPIPDEYERNLFIRQVFDGFAEEGEPLDTSVSADQFARMTAGLGRYAIETIILRAQTRNIPIDADLIKNEKRRVIRQEFGDVIELIEPESTFADIGGLDYVKDFLMSDLVVPFRTGDRLRMPMGILFLGPPGTGKSYLAYAVAAEAGVNCCKLNLGRCKGKYVGESEAKLEKALRCIESLAPMVVFMDEIDQVIRRGEDGDSGVSMNAFARITEFMSDPAHRGRIVFIGASNRPDLLDAATKRAGRFDAKLLIDIPTHEERRSIIKVVFRKVFKADVLSEKAIQSIATSTDGWTPAEIMQIATKAYSVFSDKREKTHDAAALFAAGRIINTTEDVTPMRLAAIAQINDRDNLPPSLDIEKLEASKPEPVEKKTVTPRRGRGLARA